MLVSNLNKMERIVSSHPELSWEGWDVVRHKKNTLSQFESNGAFYKGTWHKKFIFPLTKDGWSLPDSIAGQDV